VFVREGDDGNVSELFVVNADGRKLRQITSAGTLVSISPDWSPQGNDIAFSRRTPDARGSLWVVHFNGTHLRQIHVQGFACGGPVDDPDSIGCHAPRWSPDGSNLIFATNTHDIFTARLDGSGLTQVTHTGDADHPDWGTHPLAP
jgi:Tol biopolymer transport system component